MPVPDSLSAGDPMALALTRAIQAGDTNVLREMLAANSGLAHVRIEDDRGVARTLLHVVADWPGHFPNGGKTVAVLAATGADVNAAVKHPTETASAETPLHWAASSDDVAVLDALLDAGADIEAPGAVFTGGPPMSDAVVFAQWRGARRLLERGAKTTLWQAAALGLLDAVRDHTASHPGPSTEELTNALWHACRGGQLDTANYLHECGADLSWVGHDKKTPLDVARESGEDALITWLETLDAISNARS